MEINNEYINDCVKHVNWYFTEIYKGIGDTSSVDYIISSRDLACRFTQDMLGVIEIANEHNIPYELSQENLAIIGKIWLDLSQNKHVQDLMVKQSN